MFEPDADPQTYWHSPERAWTPLMWIIGGVALAVATLVLVPLLPWLVAVP